MAYRSPAPEIKGRGPPAVLGRKKSYQSDGGHCDAMGALLDFA
jgi:hypothetical protein